MRIIGAGRASGEPRRQRCPMCGRPANFQRRWMPGATWNWFCICGCSITDTDQVHVTRRRRRHVRTGRITVTRHTRAVKGGCETWLEARDEQGRSLDWRTMTLAGTE